MTLGTVVVEANLTSGSNCASPRQTVFALLTIPVALATMRGRGAVNRLRVDIITPNTLTMAFVMLLIVSRILGGGSAHKQGKPDSIESDN
jgi:hypothetical protein